MAYNRNKSKVKATGRCKNKTQTWPWQHTNCASCSGPGDDRCCAHVHKRARGNKHRGLYLQPQQPHFRHPNLRGVKRKPKFSFVTNSITDHVVRVKRRNRRVCATCSCRRRRFCPSCCRCSRRHRGDDLSAALLDIVQGAAAVEDDISTRALHNIRRHNRYTGIIVQVPEVRVIKRSRDSGRERKGGYERRLTRGHRWDALCS